jgi:hypothetical protein
MIEISPIKKQRQGFEAQPEMVGKYINEYLYSDVNPVAQITVLKSGNTKSREISSRSR